MKFYTGYFSYVKRYEEAGLLPISIARYSPKWYTGYRVPFFAPSKDLLSRYKNGITSKEEYEKEYMAYLDQNYEVIKEYFEDASDGCNIVFCCYEKPSDFCHRHLLAKWVTNNLGIEMKEYEVK